MIKFHVDNVIKIMSLIEIILMQLIKIHFSIIAQHYLIYSIIVFL